MPYPADSIRAWSDRQVRKRGAKGQERKETKETRRYQEEQRKEQYCDELPKKKQGTYLYSGFGDAAYAVAGSGFCGGADD
ncbi:MAG: hypothetical protein AAGU27_17740 [Dehalobacterium sp.]